ncbi:heme oxygenase (biliverdin-producing) [Amycolatopsis sp. 195334CR]|uniref:biliverdin-producing heme oxygenase n=1 Tax=Amycolatopsis sp. 195334CR TaxID=2814588 RepID=UPI001A8F52E2|nr:biliverdin-producing heme oxygenase [Amycolatopsis sp. 195334CR]MBN6034875.1 biliverdin-producing heme oxygenase [Amycolatopsis sp. 195334CR]
MAAPVTEELALRPFSESLRNSTKAVHERAHHSSYMDALLSGSLTLEGYGLLAAQYYFIYRALEQVTDAMAGDPVGGDFVIDELRRLPALEADLAFLLGENWAEKIEPVPATTAYVARLGRMTDWAGGYVAHHYTRYLGDLAGGQVVRALLKKTYDVTGPGALFYDFESAGSPSAFRKRYRALLDAAPWGVDERRRIIDETLMAFELNIAVLADLAETTGLESA